MQESKEEQTYLRLVWATKPCNRHEPITEAMVKTRASITRRVRAQDCECGGTGKVLLLPDLSEECPCLLGYWHNRSICNVCAISGRPADLAHGRSERFTHRVGCLNCHGTGRVPLPLHLETIVYAVWLAFAPENGEYADKLLNYMLTEVGLYPTKALGVAVKIAWQAVQARYPQTQEEKA